MVWWAFRGFGVGSCVFRLLFCVSQCAHEARGSAHGSAHSRQHRRARLPPPLFRAAPRAHLRWITSPQFMSEHGAATGSYASGACCSSAPAAACSASAPTPAASSASESSGSARVGGVSGARPLPPRRPPGCCGAALAGRIPPLSGLCGRRGPQEGMGCPIWCCNIAAEKARSIDQSSIEAPVCSGSSGEQGAKQGIQRKRGQECVVSDNGGWGRAEVLQRRPSCALLPACCCTHTAATHTSSRFLLVLALPRSSTPSTARRGLGFGKLSFRRT